MFSRRQKPADVISSVNRFIDLHRDCFSRVKHLRNVLEALPVHEKKLLIEEYSFETFHLVDELLLNCDISQSPQGAAEAESGLWTLEQLITLAPELVGSGWQRHAIESQLKKAIYPHNLLAVRKIAIRLFLVFYQSLAVCNQPVAELDRVFQCLLPYFPLRSGDRTESLLEEYCQGAGSNQWSLGSARSTSSSVAHLPHTPSNSARERAQLLQVYLDKLLEYCIRETRRVEWTDVGKRQLSADFILDRVISLYILETFPDLETNGIDIFGGWVGADAVSEALDTADPLVIARYWLIRWMVNLASASESAAPSSPSALSTAPSTSSSSSLLHSTLLFRRALFSSRRATNTLLSLMAEAMRLPLPCSNVIHKVVQLASSWIVQKGPAPFISSGDVSPETLTLLSLHTLLSFFQSPYLDDPGDRITSALFISFSILRTCRSLSSSRVQLPLTPAVWAELLSRLGDCSLRLCSRSDVLGQETAAPLAGTLLTLLVYAKAVRRVELDERIFDDASSVLERSVWLASASQWEKVLQSTTRALILHIAHVDILSRQQLEKDQAVTQTRRLRERAATDSSLRLEEGACESDQGDDCVFVHSDEISAAVNTWDGDARLWLSSWRRVCLLLSPGPSPSGVLATSSLSAVAVSLLAVGLDSLGFWVVERLLQTSSALPVLSHAVPALSAALASKFCPTWLQAHCLAALSGLFKSCDRSVLSGISTQLSLRHLSVLAPSLLSWLARPLSVHSAGGEDCLRLIGQLALSHSAAEALLLRCVASSGELTHKQALIAANALCIVSIVRGDVDLAGRLVCAVEARGGTELRLLSVLAPSLLPLSSFGHAPFVLDTLLKAMTNASDEATRAELLYLLASLALSSPHNEIGRVLWHALWSGGAEDRVPGVVVSTLLTLHSQFPLPSFSVSQPNSPDTSSSSSLSLFIKRREALLSLDSRGEVMSRNRVGRHSWRLRSMDDSSKTREGGASSGEGVKRWLERLAQRPRVSSSRCPAPILGAMSDPMDALPLPSPSQTRPTQPSSMLRIVTESKRRPEAERPFPSPPRTASPLHTLSEWRSLALSHGYIDDVYRAPLTFVRNIRHLDQTPARETHKIAVIYVGEGHEDKQSILGANNGSEAFNNFVAGLGWEVRIGRGHEGYAGGLPADSAAVYYAAADAEVIFHVSTMLAGDVASKLKHVGNDEVHVVWNEHCRSYRREKIATSFCDVLIVLEMVGPESVRVRVQTQCDLAFGPLWDGAILPLSHAPSIVRSACLEASRSYRVARGTARPFQHRGRVFDEEVAQLQALSISNSVTSLHTCPLPC